MKGITAEEGDRVALEAESDAELVNCKHYRNYYHFLFVIRGGRVTEAKEIARYQARGRLVWGLVVYRCCALAAPLAGGFLQSAPSRDHGISSTYPAKWKLLQSA